MEPSWLALPFPQRPTLPPSSHLLVPRRRALTTSKTTSKTTTTTTIAVVLDFDLARPRPPGLRTRPTTANPADTAADMQRVSALLPSWERKNSNASTSAAAAANPSSVSPNQQQVLQQTDGRPTGFNKVFSWADRLASSKSISASSPHPAAAHPANSKVDRELYWPTTLDRECDKAARILKSFCSTSYPSPPPTSKSRAWLATVLTNTVAIQPMASSPKTARTPPPPARRRHRRPRQHQSTS